MSGAQAIVPNLKGRAMKKNDFGMIGLAVMGQNLALNIERHGFPVSVYSWAKKEIEAMVRGSGKGKAILGCFSLEEFVASLKRPRKIMMMIRAGKPVDDVIAALIPLLERGDIIIDGGNSYFEDTIRRTRLIEEKGMFFIGTGVSGGEEGAFFGPSIMPGGSEKAWPEVKSVFQAIAARAEDGMPCCDWVGSDGAGHFIKMVHNGIEYGDMQMIAEAYALMRFALGLEPHHMVSVFNEWNTGELESYLIEITRDILAKKDEETGAPMVDVILDKAGQKGTGRWASLTALNLGVPAVTIAEAVFARAMSALKEERLEGARLLAGPGTKFRGDRTTFIEKIRRALYASKITGYAQGFQILRAAADEYRWNFDYGKIALLWRGGCIIRAKFLNRIREAFDQKKDLPNLLLGEYFRSVMERNQADWRETVSMAVELGVPVPAFSSALAYYDGYRSAVLPAGLIQAQRDYFGAHTYERVDQPGKSFHTRWTGREGGPPSTTYTA